ncbi:Beta-lactamase class C-like and penicillin binding proteins (PBPs) superfamily [Olavius sp. associated proteobacterium Delta 1]|nr:Beta-lactamase class C-like and penicillin binding proteins (PBPs) superfamily [Olavius sp. associated proteobacterium Delta 1]
MKRWLKIGLIGIGVVLIVMLGAVAWFLSQALPVGTGITAKYLCSSTFISQRDPEIVYQEDVAPIDPLLKPVAWRVNSENKTVSADYLGLFNSTAIYREGCGCSLVIGATEEKMRQQTFYKHPAAGVQPARRDDLPWPEGSQGPVDPASLGLDRAKLQKALDVAFGESGPDKPKKTRAIIVVYDGRLAAERYADGFHKDMSLLGWSMSKSVTNALVGIQVKNRWLDIKAPAPVAEWQNDGNPRREITIDQLLRMSDGLKFEELYLPPDDTTRMLFESYDFAAYAAGQPVVAKPDARWNYSSGSANIIARIVRQTAEKNYPNYYTFIRDELFHKIGMYSAVMEADASGTFVGSSYTFATPRDWARFGLLYLQDGVWQGERILPPGWVKYSTSPTPQHPRGEYGALFWLNAGSPSDPTDRRWPSAPRDAFAASGFQEQKVIIIPSEKLVLVRFGATSDRKSWNSDEFIANVLAALPE